MKARAGQLVGRERAAAVEAEPAEPEQPRAEEREGDVVRQDRLAAVVLAGAEHERGDERRDAGVDVHHRAAGEVEHAAAHEPAAAPDPVRHRRVDQQGPERDEGDVGPEPHPLDHGAGDQRGRDDGERALVGHEQDVRDGALGLGAHAAEPEVGEAAEQRAPSLKARL